MNTHGKASARRFNSDSVYVSFYPRAFPSYDLGMTAQQRLAEYRDCVLKPKEIPILRLIYKGSDYADILGKIWYEPDEVKRESIKHRSLGIGTVSASTYGRKASIPISERIKEYNGLVAVHATAACSLERMKQTLSALPWVWYAGWDCDKRGIFAIVATENDDYRLHKKYFVAVKEQLETLDFTISSTGMDPTDVHYVSYDPQPFIHEGCDLFSLQDVQQSKQKEE